MKELNIDTVYDYFKNINLVLRFIDDLNLNLKLYKKIKVRSWSCSMYDAIAIGILIVLMAFYTISTYNKICSG